MASFVPLRKHRSRLIMAALVGCLMINLHPAPAQADVSSLPSFDFRQANALAGWGELHDISRLEPAPGGQGMAIHIKGPRPLFFWSSARLPVGRPFNDEDPARALHRRVRPSLLLRSRPGCGGRPLGPVLSQARRMARAHHAHPATRPGFSAATDPPADRGVCRIASIRFEPRLTINAPNWTRPTVPEPTSLDPAIHSGELTFHQHPSQLGGFTISLQDRLLATGHNRPMIG